MKDYTLQIMLAHLNRWNQRRNEIAEMYLNGINNGKIILPETIDGATQVYHILAIRCKDRNALEEHLTQNGVGFNKHYPIPIHLQKAYEGLGLKEGDLPIAEEISKTELSLPMYYGLTNEEVEKVIMLLK